MGRGINLKCNKCGYQKTYYVGGGFLDFDKELKDVKLPPINKYNRRTLKEQILIGMYGNEIKNLIKKSPDEYKYKIMAPMGLYYCSNCKKISYRHIKKLVNKTTGEEIELLGFCGNCKKQLSFYEYDNEIKCPKCDARLKLGPCILYD